MSRDNEPTQPDDQPDPLDACLRDAQWPEPTPQQLASLARHWKAVSRGQAHRRWPWWIAGVAAALVVLAVSWHVISPQQERRVAPAPIQPSNEQVAVSPASQPLEAERGLKSGPPIVEPAPPQQRTEAAPMSRPANAYERLVMRAAARRKTLRLSPKQAAALDRVMVQLAGQQDVNVAELAAPLLPERDRYEQHLLRQIHHFSAPEQVAAIWLIEQLGSQRSVETLALLSAGRATRDASADALCRLAEPQMLAQIALASVDPQFKRRLLAALVERHDPRALGVYLEVASRHRLREVALGALADVEDPPVELLFEFLVGASPLYRVSAARVLGRINGPEISQRLVDMVLEDLHRDEALMALLACESEDVRQFCRAAQRDGTLLAAMNGARLKLATAIP